MPDHLAVTIPLKDIQRIQLYINTARRSLSQIQRETGADYILNGTLYNMSTFVPNCHLKADGKVLCKPDYTVSGYSWNDGPDISMDTLPDASQRNYITCTPLIVSGKPVSKLIYDVGQGGKRGRSAIGVKGGSLALYCTRDGGSMTRTPESLRDDLTAAGWDSAVMLDSGGSSQCYFNGAVIQSSRNVHDLILVYLKKGETTVEKKKVVLDPGHDAGNLANKSPDGTYYEHEFALDMGKRIQSILERHSVAVTMTRTGGGEVSLAQRCAIANAIKDLDLFVSLHSNAAGDGGWSSASGWSAYVYKTSGSGYKAAKDILEAVKDAGITVRSTPIVADSSLYVLKGTVAPAVLIEHGFHTNQTDTANLKNSAYRQKLAEAEAKGILNYLGIAWKEETVDNPSESDLAVQWVQENGIMLGNTNGDMMLDSQPTRRQIAIMFYRFAKWIGKV